MVLGIFGSSVRIEDGRCSLAHQNLKQVPYELFSKKQLKKVIDLDLSHNEIEFQGLQHLNQFENLKTLVLDHNLIKSDVNLNMGKPLPTLELLWVNSNNITNLSTFIEKIKIVCPNLQYFSMMANKACPNFFVGGTPELYEDYRHFVISRLPKLKVLDQNNVTDEERQQALQHYANLKIQPTSNTITLNSMNGSRPSI